MTEDKADDDEVFIPEATEDDADDSERQAKRAMIGSYTAETEVQGERSAGESKTREETQEYHSERVMCDVPARFNIQYFVRSEACQPAGVKGWALLVVSVQVCELLLCNGR